MYSGCQATLLLNVDRLPSGQLHSVPLHSDSCTGVRLAHGRRACAPRISQAPDSCRGAGLMHGRRTHARTPDLCAGAGILRRALDLCVSAGLMRGAPGSTHRRISPGPAQNPGARAQARRPCISLAPAHKSAPLHKSGASAQVRRLCISQAPVHNSGACT